MVFSRSKVLSSVPFKIVFAFFKNVHVYRQACQCTWTQMYSPVEACVGCQDVFFNCMSTLFSGHAPGSFSQIYWPTAPRSHLSPIPSARLQVCTASILVVAWGSEQKTPCWYTSTLHTGQVTTPYFPSFIEILILFLHYLKISLSTMCQMTEILLFL